MPFKTAFEQRKEKIVAIDVPRDYHPKIPPMAFHEEAMTVYRVAIHYEKELSEAGINKELLLDIPGRVAASMDVQAQWLQSQLVKNELEQNWENTYNEARQFYENLYQELRYFFLCAGVDKSKEMHKKDYLSIKGLIEKLSDIAALIHKNSSLLSDQGMDITKGEKAAQLCGDVAQLYGSYQTESIFRKSAMKKVRDQALLYLDEAITHVQQVAAFRFRKDPEIRRCFTCEYRRAHRRKSDDEKTKVVKSEV